MSADLLPFPNSCARHATCMQESRIAVLEQRASDRDAQLDRMETKLNWLIGAMFTGLVAVLVALLRN